MSAEILIRKAKAEDANALFEFNQAMALETEGKNLDAQILQKGVEAVFRDEGKGFYVVAETGEKDTRKIVGGLMVTFEWSDWRNGWFWWIQSVYILPRERRRGIYRRLYEFVRAAAKERNEVCGFRLYVEKENKRAQKVYQKLGMRKSHYLMFEEIL